MCRCGTSADGRSTMAETRSITGVDVTVAISLNYRTIATRRFGSPSMARVSALALKEIENNWESELCSLILVKLHMIRRIRLSAWSSETEVIEPAVCVIGRRARAVCELRPADVDDSREAVYVQRDAIRDAAFSKARPV
jgi:hypothetical protein